MSIFCLHLAYRKFLTSNFIFFALPTWKSHQKTKKSLWIKSRKKPGPKKKGKIDFSEDRKRDLAESDKGAWFDQETLVDVEGSVEGDHEELEQRPSNLSTVIGSSTQRSIAVQKSCRVTLQASCVNIKKNSPLCIILIPAWLQLQDLFYLIKRPE